MITTLESKMVTVRKKRKCFLCFRLVEIGGRMNYWVGVEYGEFYKSYCCATCNEIINTQNEEHEFPEGWVYEQLNQGQTPEDFLENIKLNNHDKTKCRIRIQAHER